MKNRYLFFKKLFPRYVVVLDKSNSFLTFYWDKKLIKYITFKEVSHVIIDNLNNVCVFNSGNNKYEKYLLKEFLLNLFK